MLTVHNNLILDLFLSCITHSNNVHQTGYFLETSQLRAIEELVLHTGSSSSRSAVELITGRKRRVQKHPSLVLASSLGQSSEVKVSLSLVPAC